MYVLMAVASDFPNGDAGSVRDAALAHIYEALGYEVILVGRGTRKRTGVFENIKYWSIFREANNFLEHLKRFYLYGHDYIASFKNIIRDRGKPSVIHIEDIPEKAINFLKQYSLIHNIPMVHDSTEWYSPCEFPLGKFDKAYYLKNRLNTKLIDKPIRVIAISRYLEKHFQRKDLKAVRIPVIMDVLNSPAIRMRDDNKIRFIYAGDPATKDYIKEIVQSFNQLTSEEKEKCELHVLGISEDQLKSLCGIKNFDKCFIIYGRVKREKVLDVLMEMDFSVLLRPAGERYAQAGFPTKAVEAMSHGVAMVCNLTSDLNLYLKDEDNSVLVESHQIKHLMAAVRKILSMDRKVIDQLKQNARITAERYFDYRKYKNILFHLIND